MSVYMGIDPWTTTIGFAFIEKINNKVNILEYWVIETEPNIELWDKLMFIYDDMIALIKKFKPDWAWIEKLFFTSNAKTAISVAEARWVMELSLRQNLVDYIELSPPEIKKWLCSNWRATKKQIQNTVKFIFNLKETPKPDDAADALAIAYLVSIIKK